MTHDLNSAVRRPQNQARSRFHKDESSDWQDTLIMASSAATEPALVEPGVYLPVINEISHKEADFRKMTWS
jgi:hypothetical protein